MKNIIKPELLAPAGNLEKLRTAFLYGADAVYVGGHVFGLRKYAENFTLDQLQEGISLAHSLHKKVYVVLNGFAHDTDISEMEPHLSELEALKPDAFIISDMGVFQKAKTLTTVPLHVSTQASITNKYAAKVWKDAGAKRVILARETSIQDSKIIQDFCNIEVEIFIHGAQCASYSGKCVISNYSAGRDSNRGGCVQSCRHTYDLFDPTTKEIERSEHVMNAKDLMGLHLLPDIMQAGIESIKVEGRMKSNMYAAATSLYYRKAIDYVYTQLINDAPIDIAILSNYENELKKVSNRGFETGGLEERPFSETINYEFDGYEKDVEFAGIIKDVRPNTLMFIDVRFSFNENDPLELLLPSGEVIPFIASDIKDINGNSVTRTQPNSIVTLPYIKEAAMDYIVRKPLYDGPH